MKRSKLFHALAVLLVLCTLCSCGQEATRKPNKKPIEELYDPPVTADTLPIIRISTYDGEEIPLDKESVNCRVSLESKDTSLCKDNLLATIRCRGNGSMTVGKRTGKYPYKLKFNQRINLFGAGDGEAKDWVLLANVGDQTMLRNYAAKLLGEKLDGIDYSPNVIHVSVYLNDEYIGVYELTEQIEAKDYRVPINDGFTGNKNGFLVELDAYAKKENEEDDINFMVGESYYTVKSNVYNDAQKNYIQQYISLVDSAITLGDQMVLANLVDMDSLVDMYILQEFSKNIDVGYSSFYMYREIDGKLHFGPPWDFDLAFGNDARLDNGSYEDLYVGVGREDFRQNHLWYISLCQNEWFMDLVRARWQEVSDTVITEVIEEVRALAALLEVDMGYNYTRWQFFGKKQQQEPEAIIALTTYKEHADYLVKWMEDRKAWLDDEFAKVKEISELTIE